MALSTSAIHSSCTGHTLPGPRSICFGERRLRWLPIVNDQIVATLIVQLVQDVIQGQGRFGFTGAEGNRKSGNQVAHTKQINISPWPVLTPADDDPVIIVAWGFHWERVTRSQQVNFDQMGPTPHDLEPFTIVLRTPFAGELIRR